MQVTIEQWRVDLVHCHVYTSREKPIQSSTGSLVHNCRVEMAVEIGRITGHIWMSQGTYVMPGSCYRFCELADALLAYDEAAIALARGQMAGCIADAVLSDREVAWLDYSIRQSFMGRVECAADPWTGRLTLTVDPSRVVAAYLNQRTAH